MRYLLFACLFFSSVIFGGSTEDYAECKDAILKEYPDAENFKLRGKKTTGYKIEFAAGGEKRSVLCKVRPEGPELSFAGTNQSTT